MESLPAGDFDGDSDKGLNIGEYAAAYPHVVAALKPLRAPEVISAFAELLTIPDLQANCFRLELLAHLAAAFCRGRVSPTPGDIKFLFDALAAGMCGRVEDPAEGVFVGLVNPSRGNFRIFEGLREGTSFYLQLVLDVLETASGQDHFDSMRRSVEGLLKLSEAVAGRAGVSEYELGAENPVPTLSEAITARLPSTSGCVAFAFADLRALGIRADDLSPFVFDPASGPRLLDQEIGNSDLELYPLVYCEDRFYLAIPTGVASAITRFVIASVRFLQIERSFEMALAARVVTLIRDTPLLGKLTRLPLARAQIEDSLIGHQLMDIDVGRSFQLIVVFESLASFEAGGLNGTHSFSDGLNRGISAMIADAHRRAGQEIDQPDGLTLIVPAGIGRGFGYSLSEDLPQEWRVYGMPLHDLMTASWLERFEPLSLWRIDEELKVLGALGVLLINQSGLLNLIGSTRELNGRIISEDTFSEVAGPFHGPKVAMLPTNANRLARREAQVRYGARRALNIEGRWLRLQKFGASPFEDDNSDTIYVSREGIENGELLGACLTQTRAWWLSLECPNDGSRAMQFEYWRSLCLWLSLAAPLMDEGYPQLQGGPIHFVFAFDGIAESGVGAPRPRDEKETRELIDVITDVGSSKITIRVRSGFEDALVQPENVGDRALVEAIIRGTAASCGPSSESTLQKILDCVCPRGGARRIHRWSTTNFRDFMRARLSEPPILLEPIDHVTSLMGLGHKLASYPIPCVISGKNECTSLINGAVETLVREICAELQIYDRRKFIEAVIRNYETTACNREHWRQTSRALVATQKDATAAMRTIVERHARFNACTVASRLLLEAGLCECPLDSGLTPGALGLGRLMAKMMSIHQFGGWSDAIRWDAMAPEIRISALGEIQAHVQFINTVYEPFGRSAGQSFVEHAIESYDSLFDGEESQGSAPSQLDTEFFTRWETEFGVSIQAFLAFLIRLEQIALEANREVIDAPRSYLVTLLSVEGSVSEVNAAATLDFVTSAPRQSWFQVPRGHAPSDWYPWRFRRRLAILRRPFLQLADEPNPTILCAPGLIRDAFQSMVTWYRRGEIQAPRTRGMQQWMGRVNNVQRSKFNETVAERLRQLGWEAKPEVKVTEILGRSFDRNYGDVDVLAWRTDTSRILAIECKDLQGQTTISEVAEQLSDFRGETRADGKRDHLKRHLDRLAILSENAGTVARFLNLSSSLPIEGHLVFSRNVPMRFAWQQMANRVKLSLLSELESI